MISDNPGFTDPAMDVIRRADPEQYRLIERSDVPVHPVMRGDEPSMRRLDADDPFAAYAFGTMALGLTHRMADGSDHIYLNAPALRDEVTGTTIPEMLERASTLVHEEQHARDMAATGDSTEASAYATELAFDRKAGNRALIRRTEETARSATGN
jgi:hypothetical protein